MSSAENYSGPTDLVYQVDDYKLIVADRRNAVYTAQLWHALTSKTWAEFRAKLPEGGLDEFLELFAEERDDDGTPIDTFPKGDEPFGPFVAEDFPEWLAQSMLAWLPTEVADNYVQHEVGTDGYIPAAAADDVLAALRAQGCTVEPSPVFLI